MFISVYNIIPHMMLSGQETLQCIITTYHYGSDKGGCAELVKNSFWRPENLSSNQCISAHWTTHGVSRPEREEPLQLFVGIK